MPGGWSSDYDDEDPEQVRRRELAAANSARLTRRMNQLIRDGVADPAKFQFDRLAV